MSTLDEFPNYPAKVFLDSNIVLEALPIQKLPWHEIGVHGPILVLLTPTVLKEVDSKKKDGRLAPRAREFNRLIAPIAAEGRPIRIVESPIAVDLMIVTCNRVNWKNYDDLDPSEGDDRIIAEILHAKNIPSNQKLLVSQDINPLFAAKRHGIAAFHAAESWLPPPGPSPAEKELSRLRQQIKNFEMSEPRLEVSIKLPAQPITIFRVNPLTDEEESALSERIVELNPIPQQKWDILNSMQFDHGLDGRYSRYLNTVVPDFVKVFHTKLELLFGQIPIDVLIFNKGNIRAEHLKVDIRIIGGWFNSNPILAGRFPAAPKIRHYDFPMPFHNPHIRTAPNVGRHEVDFDEPRKAETFSVQCVDFRQNQEWAYNGVAWLNPYFDGRTAVILKVTAANLHGELTFPFEIDKSSKTVQAKDLADLKSGQIVEDFYIKPMINRLLEAHEFDMLESDSLWDL